MTTGTTTDMTTGSPAPVDVTIERDGFVGIVEVHRPPNNFFDTAMIGGIADAYDELATDGTTRAIVLCTEGKHFCAGANFGGPRTDAPAGPHLYEMAARLFEQPLPVIAAVQGSAIGGGMGLALSADFRVAAAESRFGANFAKLGFHHGFALSVTLPRAAGEQAALDLLLSGRRIGGEEAVRLGVCDRLVAQDQLRPTAVAWAHELATSAPLAVRSIRATMRADLADRARAAMARERAEQDRLQRTDDWREGVAAVAERRDANFSGR
jgi:enoyl-CoA hydratase/carnithine racemase